MGNTKSNSKNYKKDSSFWTHIRALSPSSGVYLGAGAFLVLQLLTSLCFPHSAYAAFSASVSRSGTVTLAEAGGGTIKPSSAGTLGTGSDTVSVTTNCSAGYNLYVSATSTGGTSLKLSGASDPSAAVNLIPTSSTVAGSETTLGKDTWGVGKTASSFAGLQSYSSDTGVYTPLYTGTTNASYDFYYGANISTAKTPGSYTGEVLYTVVMSDACLKYTLKFDGNGATTNNLPSGTTGHEYPTPRFGSTVDLSQYSGTDMIARTGYTLSGWKISGGDGTLLPTNSNTVLDDGESTELTLVAQWTANTYTIQYNKGSDTSVSGTAPSSQSGSDVTYGNNVTLRANTLSKTGYHFTGWSRTNSSTSSGTKHYNASTSYAVSTLASDFSVANTNGATMNLYPVFAANTYTIAYDGNGATSGSTTSQTSQAYGSNVTLRANGFTRDNYNFLGWSLSSSATSSSYTPSTSYGVASLASAANVTNTNGATITLYAVWELATPQCEIDGNCMQGWTGCPSLSSNQQITLVDKRDNHSYTVKKLPDGKCWMTQNLTLNGVELTSADTNFTSGGPYYIPKDGGAGSLTDSSTKNATTGYNFASGQDNQAMFKFRSKNSSVTNDSDTGYYNFYTATLGYSYANDGKTSGSSSIDICPKGWRLPWTSDSGTTRTTTADFYVLANSYNTSATWSTTTNTHTSDGTIKNGMYLTAAANGNNAAGFSYSGYWNGTSVSSVGSSGFYWSSSVYNTNAGYRLYFDSSSVYPQDASGKYYGYAVRCVAKETMQEFSASNFSTTVGTQTTLVDARDGKEYTVKRLPDGKVWMTQNLALGMNATSAGLTLTSADTNTTSGTYYLPPAGKQGSITSSSTLTSNTAANFSTSNDNQAKTKFRSKNSSYTNDSDTGYYNFYTATLGYSYYNDGKTSGSSTQDICPKGWRLPKTTDSGTTVSTTGTANDFTYLAQRYSTSGWQGTATSSNYYIDSSTSVVHTGLHTGTAANGNNYAGFSYAGYYDGTSRHEVGSRGFYWSSSVYDANGGYFLGFLSSYLYPQDRNNKYVGRAVRCIAKEASGCFTAGTKIQTTMDGDTKNIEDIKIGDEVVSYDPEKQEYYMTEVIDTIAHDGEERASKLARLTLDNGTTLEMTLNHPILTTTGYKALQDKDFPTLTADDIILTTTGAYNITSIDVYDTEPTMTYNLTVKGRDDNITTGPTHSYISNGVIVHNGHSAWGS